LSVAAEAPAGLVYALGALVGSCDGAVRPAQAALLPSLSPTPEDLTAGNALSTTVESVGIFVGPAIGALLLSVVGIDVTLAATVVLFAAGAALIAGVHAPSDAHHESRVPSGHRQTTASCAHCSAASRCFAVTARPDWWSSSSGLRRS
jgi:predicted MFS family arabinose efflux permease